MNWLVIGIGDIATRRVIPAILAEPRSVLYGVVTRDRAKGERFAGHVWTDWAEAVLDPAIDAVYVATPVALHAPQTMAALAAGKHVLCEKPMAMNYGEACRMAEAARQSGRLLGVAYYRRMYPKLERAAALLADGAIGRPVLACVTCHGWFDPGSSSRTWLGDPAMAGGGPLYDVGSHRIDALNYLFGQPRAVSAHLSNSVLELAVEDSATVLIDYAAGVRGIVDVRWNTRLDADGFRITGTEGELDLTPLNGPQLVSPRGPEQIPPHDNLHYPAIENFVSAVSDGTPLRSSGETALWTDWVIEQALRASRRLRYGESG